MRLSLLLLVTLLAPHVQAKLGAPNSDSNSDTDTVSKSESESGVQHGTPTLRLVRQRELQNDLVYYGSNPVERFPLGVCEGDCDDDADCQVGLVCFQRDGNSDPIPGCSGSDNSRNDYCVLPSNAGQTPSLPTPTVPLSTPAAVPISDRFSNAGSSSNTISSSNVLSLVGNNGQPASRFPLGMCEGHCEGDHQCAPGLVCHSRVTGQTFPGCIAGINTNWYANYCLLPQNQNNLIATQPQPQPQPRPQSQPIFTPRPTSRPTPRPTSRPTSRPTPAPVPRPTPSGITREQSMELVLAGNNGFPASAFPLQRRQGDCDTDSECAPGLVCMSDRSVANIPGCVGVRQYADYCVSSSDTAPPTPQPTPAPTRPPVTPGIPTSSIAIPGLVISTLPPSPVPTLNPTPNPTAFPTPFPTPFPTNRRAPDPTPPPTNKPTFGIPTMAPTNPEPYYGVRLRLYWEEGYTWQESTREKFWCMMSDYRVRNVKRTISSILYFL